ncbi:hypothetical protein D1224_01000 [Henriciella barbarensis]|uniref:Uncharacterized protein n=1 Tax=Henriciella barbarensis TaxID=86342 RepID=A0A399R857_9PROT|nr:hypothetical protein D1224_01000 [Henriciella barbarensis]
MGQPNPTREASGGKPADCVNVNPEAYTFLPRLDRADPAFDHRWPDHFLHGRRRPDQGMHF